MSVNAYIALGSNLGDRAGLISSALREVARLPGTAVVRVSGLIETEAVGPPGSAGPAQGPYLNAAVEVVTSLNPAELIAGLLAVERGLGRERVREVRWGARFIDLDLLLYGGAVIDAAGLTVPHPRMHERRFVLQPLSEIAPSIAHPTRHTTVQELLLLL